METTTCQCQACGCDQPATTTDDAGVPVCEECSQYAVDDDGEVRCSRSGGVETVTESCGAGGQVRSYTRIIPPEMPDQDPSGAWACCWASAGQEDRVESRHTTREQAETACASHDWPPPGDHTRYLCGYVVRQWVHGEWAASDEDEIA